MKVPRIIVGNPLGAGVFALLVCHAPAEEPPAIKSAFATTTVTILQGGGNWLTTQTNPDDTFNITAYVDGLMDYTAIHEAGADPESDAPLASTAMRDSTNDPLSGYDALNRPTHQRDSRTGVTTTAYLSATADVVKSVTDPGNRKTSFTYDIRGRRTHVDAPATPIAGGGTSDNLTETIYNSDGTVQEVIGDQTYRVSYETYGGCPLLGVNGVVIIADGSSTALAVRNAIRVAMETVDHRVNPRIEEAMAALKAARLA